MKAEELRLGNWYQWYAEGKYYYGQIQAKDFVSDYILNFEPIPLSEEVLLKCGFVRDGNTDYYTCRKVGFTINLSGTIGYRTCIWSNEHIKHIHQLQNLFYDITGEELEVSI